jgi:hypothetical protein
MHTYCWVGCRWTSDREPVRNNKMTAYAVAEKQQGLIRVLAVPLVK